MGNATDTYWDVNGVSLQTLARNIETLAELDSPPEGRGENIVVPYRTGELFVPKTMGSRILPFKMWVRGTDDNGRVTNRKNQYDDNWRQLRNLLWGYGNQFTLRKRFRVGGVLRTAVAQAEFAGGLKPTMIGRNASKFQVDLKLADPYFYDEAYTQVNLAASQVIAVAGDAPTTDIVITALGARSKPRVRNAATATEVTYNNDLLVGDSAEIRIKEFRANLTKNGAAATRANATIIHSGAPEWLVLKPGNNSITSTGSGTGLISLQYKAAWL
jgi:hypothetical protein